MAIKDAMHREIARTNYDLFCLFKVWNDFITFFYFNNEVKQRQVFLSKFVAAMDVTHQLSSLYHVLLSPVCVFYNESFHISQLTSKSYLTSAIGDLSASQSLMV